MYIYTQNRDRFVNCDKVTDYYVSHQSIYARTENHDIHLGFYSSYDLAENTMKEMIVFITTLEYLFESQYSKNKEKDDGIFIMPKDPCEWD